MPNDLWVDLSSIEFHRNGISGAPFHVVRFEYRPDGDEEPGPRYRLIAVVFDEPKHVAVTGPRRGMKWRGDDFEPQLRAMIAAWEEDRLA